MPDNTDLYFIRQKQEDRDRANHPVMAVVRQTQPETESVKVESYGEPGTSTVAVRHPYMGKNSWIRCMPESGTSVVTQMIRQPPQIELWGYISHRLGALVDKARDDNSTIYRQLREGEIEVISSGRAYSHYSEDGNLTQNGGIIEQHLSQTELEATVRAPTHKRQLDQHGPTELAHEERFGLVKRPDQQKPNALQVYLTDGDAYQYEYGRWLRDDEGKDLISLHEGHLYDASQQPIKNSLTNKEVRLRRYITHRSQGDMTFDIDQDLNMVLANSSKATTTDLDFGLKNDIKLTSQKLDLNILKSSNQIFAQSVTMRAPKFRANSPDVGFGAAPVQPAVLGTTLTTNVLTPMTSMISAAMNVLSADPGLAPSSQNALAAMASGLSALSNSINSVLSTEVKFTK